MCGRKGISGQVPIFEQTMYWYDIQLKNLIVGSLFLQGFYFKIKKGSL